MQWFKKFSDGLDRFSGVEIRKKVMQGSEEINTRSSGDKKAEWIGNAMERVDSLIEKEIRKNVLLSCSHVFPKTRIKPLKSIYKDTNDIDAVITFMHKDRSYAGLSYYEYPIREGNIIYVTKIPFNPKRYKQSTDEEEKKHHYCHCGLVKGALKSPEVNVSTTFCYCGAGWYKTLWEGIIDKPVEVEVMNTVLQGANNCKFAIHLPLELEGNL